MKPNRPAMRILLLHNSYQHAGGEDAVVAGEAGLLRDGGHHVCLEAVTNDLIGGFAAKTRAALVAPHDPARKDWMRALIERHAPDVVHVHNFFPLLTPAVHEAAAEGGVAVVQTLHNYRLLCAGALLMREGVVCEKCLGGSNLWSIANRCYRGSTLGSLAVARMQWRARRRETWRRHVHRFIALTEFARMKFVAGGLMAERIAIKPNFVIDPGLTLGRRREGAIFVGRLSHEKGVHILIEAWKRLPSVPLVIVGDGPERARLEAIASPNVRFLGQCAPQKVRVLMARAHALVMPSLCYETFGMTIVEAFACNLPVIASRLGAMAELVKDGEAGLLFDPGDADDLAAVVGQAFADPTGLAAMGATARAIYERRYTPERNLATLEAIYRDASAEASRERFERAAQ
jgi:glycosyltransferase involved in cell wall biosynthesis